MIENYDEDVKHKRKKESNTSKSNKKSNHKHIYEDCLLIENNKYVYKVQYCTICGKRNNTKWFDFSPLENEKFLQLLSNDEKLEKYKDLKRFEVKDIFKEKFVKF